MKRAFTLIELLIVIAIIAILALIAVPNFLEAQVRAKVARVHADMRTVALGVEAYCVDWGDYPLGSKHAKKIADLSNLLPNTIDANIHPYMLLSTPVAYCSIVPVDVFIEKGKAAGSGGNHPMKYETFGDDKWGVDGADHGPEMPGYGYLWCISSFGPSRSIAGASREGKIIMAYHGWTKKPEDIAYFNQGVYDPSNGTLSSGRMMRTNKGAFPD